MSLTALIDIGTTSVGGALLASPRSQKEKVCSRVVFSTRNETSFQEEIDLPHFLAGIESVLKKTIADIQLSKNGSPRRILCFLSGPFYAAQTRVIKYEKSELFVATPELVSGLVKADWEKLQKDGFAGQSFKSHELLENRIMSLKLNGYVSQPYGQTVTKLEIFNFISVSSTRILNRFRKILTGAFHRRERDIEFHSFVFPLYRVLTDLLPAEHHALLVDIGGELTEIAVVWQGLLWETVSFPLGRNFVVRKLATLLKTSPPEAYSALRLYLEKKCDPATEKKISEVVAAAKSEWFNYLLRSLDESVDNCLLPENVYLVGDRAALPLFRDWLMSSHIDSNLAFGRRESEVIPLREELFANFCDHANAASQDLSLMIESIFYDKIR